MGILFTTHAYWMGDQMTSAGVTLGALHIYQEVILHGVLRRHVSAAGGLWGWDNSAKMQALLVE
jgi:hypothetical protein